MPDALEEEVSLVLTDIWALIAHLRGLNLPDSALHIQRLGELRDEILALYISIRAKLETLTERTER